jgi:hypothetical protein
MTSEQQTLTGTEAQPALAPRATAWEFQAYIPIFMLLVFATQVAVLVPALAPFRTIFRIAAFASSLAFLAATRGRIERMHPATYPALWVLMIITVQLAHPTTNTLLAGVAQIALYTAILGPLFWVPRLRADLGMLRKLIMVIWGFHAISATVGVLQVVRPGSFQFNVSSMISARGEDYLRDLSFVSELGAVVFRPMGLSDIPGGAANSGFYALLFGVGFLLIDRRVWFRALCGASFGIGLLVLYLSQVRSVLIIAVCCLLVFAGTLLVQKQWTRFVTLSGFLAGGLAVGLGIAARLSSGETLSNLRELLSGQPFEVFYDNRGQFFVHTYEHLLPRFPLGAGLGRWGMTSMYFGSSDNPATAPMWVEIQVTGWLLDGGVPMILAYTTAILVACWTAWRLSRGGEAGHPEVALWAGLVLAYNLGAFVLTFSYPVFIAQWGMEFWLLNATLFAAAVTERRRALQQLPAEA